MYYRWTLNLNREDLHKFERTLLNNCFYIEYFMINKGSVLVNIEAIENLYLDNILLQCIFFSSFFFCQLLNKLILYMAPWRSLNILKNTILPPLTPPTPPHSPGENFVVLFIPTTSSRHHVFFVQSLSLVSWK